MDTSNFRERKRVPSLVNRDERDGQKFYAAETAQQESKWRRLGGGAASSDGDSRTFP